MTIKLRQHQSQLNQVIDGIIAGSPRYKNIKKIIIAACPGAGKGSVPVNAGKLIKAGLADNMCVVVPRKSLQQQCESVFMDEFFKKLFGVNLSVRASTNERSPCRGLHGFVTTFQALGHDHQQNVLKTIKSRRYILIGDEVHHLELESPWHLAFKELVEAAEFVILMSGTLSRANKKEIAFMDYKNGYVSLSGDDQTHVIKYTMSRALKEQAVLPIDFHLHDGSFEWETHKGDTVSVNSFNSVEKKDYSSALFTALKTEFANQLIDQALVHWLAYKKENNRAKILFVCARIEDARKCMEYLTSLKIPSLLATSHDSKDCEANILAFKRNAPVLVTIAVAYEGMDVPPISHVCVLTRIRSNEWLEQCCSRATRHDKEAGPYREQTAHIFAPKDKLFLKFVDAIEKEQATRAKTHSKESQLPLFELFETNGGGREVGPCTHLKSQIIDMVKQTMGTRIFFEREVLTPKQEEMRLRRDIDRYLKRYAIDQGYEFMEVNKTAKEINNKPRALMELKELKYFFNRIQVLFPMYNNGSFIPYSNCAPVFTTPKEEKFDLNKERFF